ncbi:thyroxine 5-deiodinase-like [Homarus americanus]|uniref:Iodothyronine deiodinase n=1 Tax=Homarus americanus TaxID=6706 RepID=A0A8J5JPL4_HOMAM|nr:thyroxine 5-deiodinase-like [Homarus americanus]XP_042240442.1 thyroxine 5-deiodinase-like [Homarus americanus]KAG7158744.1 Thyroxine 5-deiodinase-like [Homarus americanus]
MANLQKFHELCAKYKEVADFVLVYISEAHPTDGWTISGSIFQLPSHRTLEDRTAAAGMMVAAEHLECPVVMDSLEDLASRAYGALPERLYIVLDGIIVYKGGPGPWGYKLRETESWLKAFKENQAVC